jgi:hypothetical protein
MKLVIPLLLLAALSSAGETGPTNPDCAKKCIDKGSAAVFVSEQGKQMLKVSGDATVKDDIGDHLEITGVRDGEAKTIAVTPVKRIGEYQGPSCARPKKK